MGFDYAMVACADGVDLDVALAVARETLVADEVAWVAHPHVVLYDGAPAVGAFSFLGPSSTDRGMLKLDLGRFAEMLAKRLRRRSLVVFLAEHYLMAGYRLFDRGLSCIERIYWEDTERSFPEDFDYNELVADGFEKLLGVRPLGASCIAAAHEKLLDAANDQLQMLTRGGQDVALTPITWDEALELRDDGGRYVYESAWCVSFEATGGLRHVLRYITTPS